MCTQARLETQLRLPRHAREGHQTAAGALRERAVVHGGGYCCRPWKALLIRSTRPSSPGETGTSVLENGESFAEIEDRGPAFRGPIAVEGWPIRTNECSCPARSTSATSRCRSTSRSRPLTGTEQFQRRPHRLDRAHPCLTQPGRHRRVQARASPRHRQRHLGEGSFETSESRRGAADDLERLRGVDRHEPGS